MSIELFDVVDRNDQVIGTTDKPTAHETGQLHRIAAVLAFNAAGELYVQHHKIDGKLDHSVGGHVRKGETYAEAAVREGGEELGLDQPLEEVAVSIIEAEHPRKMHIYGIYTCVVNPDWEFVPNDEVEKIEAMKIEDIRQAMTDHPELFTRGFQATLAEYLRFKGIE